MRLPLFPLSSVLLPGGRMPLRLFEPRYLDMVSRCLRVGEGFGVCLIESGGEVGEPAQPHAIGTLAYIADWDQGADGLLQIIAEGAQRYRLLHSQAQPDNLLVGEVELLAAPQPQPLQARHGGLATLLEQLLEQLVDAIHYPVAQFDDAEWVSGRLAELLPVDAGLRQRWLELDDANTRLDDIARSLAEMARDA